MENKDKIQAQQNYCKETGNPRFAPADGICWTCKKDIFEKISLEKAGSELITGCPFCHRSYCD